MVVISVSFDDVYSLTVKFQGTQQTTNVLLVPPLFRMENFHTIRGLKLGLDNDSLIEIHNNTYTT